MRHTERHLTLVQAAQCCGISMEVLARFVSLQWICPAESQDSGFDHEDIARARLIHELQEVFGVNDEAVPIILHLLDQLHLLQSELKRAD